MKISVVGGEFRDITDFYDRDSIVSRARRFTVSNADQRTPEWYAARCGVATASRAGDIVAKIKTGEAAARRDYRAQLVAERLTGQPQDDTFVNADMQRGIDLEADARRAYEAATGTFVEEVGFLLSTSMAAGASLDGVIGGDFGSILELKVPRVATHLQYLKDGKLPARYQAQVTHQMLLCGASYCDFCSYCPALPSDLSLFIVRVHAEQLDLAGYERQLTEFLDEVAEEVQLLQNWRKNRESQV